MDVSTPSTFGRYRVIRRIGQGAMGAVFEAVDPELHRRVAVKMPMTGAVPQTVEARRRFLQEATAAARVSHPNVCPVHDVGEQGGLPYVVMAYVDGESLAERLAAGPLPVADAVEIIIQVAAGLEAVHQEGILHRDVKPGNILLGTDGRRLLSDFGLAHLPDSSLTATGAILGTPAFMAPEQAAPELGATSPRSDQYSLAAVLYRCLAGRTPFEGSTPQVLAKLVRDEPPPLASLAPSVDPALAAIVHRAMARDPAHRFESVAAFRRALEGWVARTKPDETTVPPSGTTKIETPNDLGSPTSRRPARLVLIGTALIAVTIIGSAAFRGLMRRGGSATPAKADADGGGSAVAAETTETGSTAGAGGALAKTSPSGTGAVADGASTAADTKTAPLNSIRGWIDIRVWNRDDPQRRNVGLQAAGLLPLTGRDEVRVEAELTEPAYVYVIWVTSDGRALPVYPWRDGDWSKRPGKETPMRTLSLPEERLDGGWPMDENDPTGMESLILLARATPLPADVSIPTLLRDLPRAKEQSGRSAVWFENGKPVLRERERAPKLFDPNRRDDPLIASQRLIHDRLGPLSSHLRAVSFSFVGRPATPTTPPEKKP
jgi:serine/threonine-protein kinase